MTTALVVLALAVIVLGAIGAILIAFRAGDKAGKARVERDQAARAAEVKDAQLEIAADRPRDRDELIDRLRKNGL